MSTHRLGLPALGQFSTANSARSRQATARRHELDGFTDTSRSTGNRGSGRTTGAEGETKRASRRQQDGDGSHGVGSVGENGLYGQGTDLFWDDTPSHRLLDAQLAANMSSVSAWGSHGVCRKESPPNHRQRFRQLSVSGGKEENDWGQRHLTRRANSWNNPARWTLILPQLSGFPQRFGDKLRFLGQWILVKFQEIVSNSSVKWSSKPTFFARAQFKAKRSTLIPTAKALHRAMAQALAAGDKDTLNRICSQNLAVSLCASIDSRPVGRRYGWELVKYTNPLFYPSIRSHRMSPLSTEKTAPMVRQVVVAISSKQRRVVYDKEGNVVPGSEKEMDVVENVAMGCIVDPRTWQQTEWRLIGTIKSSTEEAYVGHGDDLDPHAFAGAILINGTLLD
ncbi:hypothetical protein VTJ49DRAFT_2108 [Mycothermus thermophilus]|uniref:Uncharacterized protein n=1 Tax=Humicola insolens TaxID=85995 RepID=A0ABR3VAM5_HUMIN